MNMRRFALWGSVALWLLGSAGCLAPPVTREATQAPSAATSTTTAAARPASTQCSSGNPALTIAGTVSDGTTGTGLPLSQTKIFPLGLPCRQATVDASGNFSLILNNADAVAVGLGAGRVTLLAMQIQTQFAKVAAARADVPVTGPNVSGVTLALGYPNAPHVAVAFQDGSSLTAAAVVGITDDAALGPTITLPGALGQNSFETAYLPPGTYVLRIDSSSGKSYFQPLVFPAGSTFGDWFFPAKITF